jgi:hypothetical protein
MRANAHEWDAPSDREITRSLKHERDLFARAREAQQVALEAQARVARAATEHQDARARALASGQDDPGAFDPSELESGARAAADTRDALAQAAALASQQTLDACDERAKSWQAATSKRVEGARVELRELIDRLDVACTAFADALVEQTLATDASARSRTLPKLRAGVFQAMPDLGELRAFASRAQEDERFARDVEREAVRT